MNYELYLPDNFCNALKDGEAKLKSKKVVLTNLFLILLTGCIGTDIINDPVIIVSERVVVSPNMAAIEIDSSFQFTVVFYDSLGEPASDINFTWQSENSDIAMVSTLGTCLGLQAGQTTILAEANGVQSNPVLLTVVANPNQVATVLVTPDSSELSIGDTVQLSATAYNLDGLELQDKTISWRSNDTQIVTVDNAGLVTAQSNGTAQIFAIADGIESMPVVIKVASASERTGQFVASPGSGYNVEGTATLRILDNGQLELELGSDFSASRGPGLVVILSSSSVVSSSSLNLGKLNSFKGSQTYEVPSNVELSTYEWVIIHCLPFDVTFGYAQLQ